MRHLYVYYKVPADQATRLRSLVLAMQARLANRIGGPFYLRRKLQVDENQQQTWLEIYENVQSNFETLLLEAVDAGKLTDWIVGERHCESFSDF